MERYVPVEYTSSPIVDILSSTSQECRPTPNTAPTFAIRSVTCCASGSGSSSSPCRNDDDNRSSADQSAEEMPPWKNGERTENTGDELDARSYDDEFKQEAQTSNSFDDGPDQIALLERIVRTHPVWYLQHVNRSVAVHLLRPMQPGVFIVRASSKKNSMALSIRLDNPSSADIDHYLIQTDKRTRQVHLQASPFRFKSLPLLIEHYCTHGEELQVRLSLPVAIRECPSTRQLQSIALMGQDFWISDIAKRQSKRERRDLSSTRPMPKILPTTVDSTKLPIVDHKRATNDLYFDDSMDSEKSTAAPVSYHHRHQQQHLNRHQYQLRDDDCLPNTSTDVSSSKHLIASERDTGTISSTTSSNKAAAATHHQSLSDGANDENLRAISSVRKSFLKNFRLITNPTSSTTSPTSACTTSPSKQKSALTQSSTHNNNNNNNANNHHNSSDLRPTNSTALAHCEVFNPFQSTKLSGSQSAYTITSSTATGDWNRKRAEEMPYPNEWPNAIVPQMGTFKPKIPLLSPHKKENIRRDSSHNTNKTNNNVRLNGLNLHSNVRNISKPAIKPKPLALRRERSDLTGSTSARRLAYHAENHSPGPLCSSPRRALLPPSDSLDGNALIGCLEELKRKREEVSMNGIRGSPTMGPSRRISPKFNANVCRPNAVDSNKFSISLKPHSSGYVPKGQHRLSVPDLAELAYGKMGATNAMMAHGGVASSAKALTSKLGRSPGTGELQAITEGLVTPVVRRKQYLREIPVQVTTSPNQPVSPSQSAKRSFIPCERSGKNVNQITKDSGVGTTVLNEHGFTKRSFSERYRERLANGDIDYQHHSISSSHSHSISTTPLHPPQTRSSKPAWKQSAQKREFPSTSSSSSLSRGFTSQPQSPTQSPANNPQSYNPTRNNLFPNKPTAAWSAVNNELKSRQKIAKVRPTPQAPSNSHWSNKSPSLVDASSPKSRPLRPPITPPTNKTKSSPSSGMQPEACTSVMVDGRSNPHQADFTTAARDSPVHRICDYAQLSDCIEVQQNLGHCDTQSPQSTKEDDSVSVAGTVFNEPWDSNVWENLLDLAHYGAEKPCSSTLKRQHFDVPMTSCLEEPIAEEEYDDEIACSLETSSDGDADDEHLHKCLASEDDSTEYGTMTLRKRNGFCPEKIAENHRELQTRREVAIVERVEGDFVENIVFNSNGKDAISKSPSVNGTANQKDDVCINSLLNMSSNTETISSGTHTLCSRKTLNSHSLPRTHPRCYTHENPLFESLDDIPSSIRAISPVISPPRLRGGFCLDPGTKIQEYVERLSAQENTVFGATLRRFIECTIEGEESDPQVVIRNVRQFLNGIKNYLVKHGEGELHELIENERTRLNANEFLNIDAILEVVLHKIVLCPVKPHLYHLMVREHSKNGSLQLLSENLAYVRTLSPEQIGFGVNYKFITPSAQKMDSIKICMRKMQHHYSPLKKLDNLLRVIYLAIGPYPSSVNSNCSTPDVKHADNMSTISDVSKVKNLPPADELVRWLVYLLARTSTIGCEVEAWYMWELLPKQLLTSGDSSYYLIALFSAIDLLKSVDSIRKLASVENCSAQDEAGSSSSAGSISPVLYSPDAFIRVAIPDELDGSIRYHTFPGAAQMTAGKLCRVIANQFGITNPEDNGLYLLVDGFETCLLANECPDTIRHQLQQAHKSFLFAYKRHEAKIAWPKAAISGCPSRA